MNRVTLFAELSHPLVRDLAWAVFSEDLIHANAIGSAAFPTEACRLAQLTPARAQWLLSLDRAPQALVDHLASSRERRLGLYFESLWHFFLHCEPAAELLAHNLPVREGSRTLGEFDCLYRCRERGDIVHLELAVKFYLHTGAGSGGSCDDRADWLGPGRHDRLDRKLDRLAEHQTRLASTPAARDLLGPRGLQPTHVETVVKGRLFRHPDQACLPPRGFNPACGLLFWYHADRLPATIAEQGEAARYSILRREHWLAPLRLTSRTQHLAFDEPEGLQHELESRFTHNATPLLVASLDARGDEQRRFFVSPPGWPGSVVQRLR